MKFHYSILIILLINAFLNSNRMVNSLDCLIYNKQYKYEYLYQSTEINTLDMYGSKVYIFPLKNLFNLDTIRWSLFLTSDNSTFFFKSFLSDEYLCSSPKHLDESNLRRLLYTTPIREGKNCEWKLIKVNSSSQKNGESYLIINAYYNEQMYAPSFFFKKDKDRRNIYLWYDNKKLDFSSNFRWVVECLNFGPK